jgi:hypothetical protein
LKGKSYFESPKWIADKKACLNIKNTDDRCFEYTLLAGMMLATDGLPKNADSVTHYDLSELKVPTGVKYPIETTQINKYEKLNEVAINLYYYEKEGMIEPLRVSSLVHTGLKEIDMLLLQEGEKHHYILVKSLSRLLSSQTSKHGHKTHCCKMCLSQFQGQYNLENHIEVCKLLNKDKSKCILPFKSDNILKFKHHVNAVPDPFAIYADFESFIQEKVHTANSFA